MSNEVGQTLKAFCEEYIPKSANEILTNLGYRILALGKFIDSSIDPPKCLAWTFLFVSQVIWSHVAMRYPSECGVEGLKPQRINEKVNADLTRLCTLALKKTSTHDMLKTYKVLRTSFN